MSTIPATESAFAIFDLPPRPLLEQDALKENFARQTAELHPDRFRHLHAEGQAEAEQRYSALNRAYQTLRDNKERLLHLFELETGAKPRDIMRIPPGTMDLFVEIGQACQAADAYFKDKEDAFGALAKAKLAAKGMDLLQSLQTLANKVNAWEQGLNAELQKLDAAWIAGEHQAATLETLYRKYSYSSRWKQQLDERIVALFAD
ncbi:MAG: DnaJ family molecular chaperone [Candidatus Methylacidiphilales bacterium]